MTAPQPTGRTYTVVRTEEVWVDSAWHGRRLTARGRLVAGTPPPNPGGYVARRGDLTPRDALMLPSDTRAPGDQPNLYGDGPLATLDLDTLPADAQTLRAGLRRDVARHLRGATAAEIDAATLRGVLVLLTEANTTPDQRATLIRTLGGFPAVEPIGSVSDRLGREGRGVEISLAGEAPLRVLFDMDTSELLQWSQSSTRGAIGRVYTIAATGHVARIGERP